MLAFPSQVGTLSGIGALSASPPITPVRFDVVDGVGLVKRMAVFAVGLAGHVMRAVSDAVALVIGVGTDRQVGDRIVGGVAVKVSDLHSLGVADEGQTDKSMYQPPRVSLPISMQSEGKVALRIHKWGKYLTFTKKGTSRIPHFSVNRLYPTHVTGLVNREPRYGLPSLHDDILSPGSLL